MKSKSLSVGLVLAALLALSAGLSAAQGPAPQGPAGPQAVVGSAFTYQGQLLKDGSPVNANCTMVFSLYDDAAGNPVGSPITLTVTVANGLFTAPLDFGSGVFTGDARWLEVAVQCPGDAGFNTLTPRQALTAAPYALSLRPGATISGTVSSGNVLSAVNTVPDWFAIGVYGESRSNFYGYGVYGYTPAGSGWAVGVVGETDSPNGSGVVGWGPNEGVYGLAQADSGETYGVYGRANSTAGRGIYGYASATSGVTYGVFAEAASTNGRGVWGHATATSGTTIGVYGWSDSPVGTGVNGRANTSTGVNRGVFGLSYSTQGMGVQGVGGAESGTNYGVYGSTSSPNGYGVYYVGGIGGTGLNTSIVETQNYGWRHFYTVESPAVLFEDVGSAQLVDGQAVVSLDPIFAQTVNLERPYQVFLTAQGGEFVLLLVAAKSPTSFTVRGATLDGRPASCAFDYRIVAKRLGYEDVRTAAAADPTVVERAARSAAIPEEQP